MTLNEWAIQHRETLIDNPYLLPYLSETCTSDEITAFTVSDLDTIMQSTLYATHALKASVSELVAAMRETRTGSAIVSLVDLVAKVLVKCP